jgi:hypothetical protein
MQSWVTKSAAARARRLALQWCAVVVAVGAALAAPATSRAADSYAPGSSFGTAGSGSGELTQTNFALRMAVQDSTGHVFVAEEYLGVKVYDSDGTYLTTVTGLSSAAGIAIDQSTDEIYVSDWGAGQIVRYTSDGAATPTLTQDLTYLSPAAGGAESQIGNFGSPITIDPATGDLLVADQADGRVKRFTRGGAYVSSFVAVPSGFQAMRDVIVDGVGVVYVSAVGQQSGPGLSVTRYAADGTLLGALEPLGSTPETLAFDAKTGNVVVVDRQSNGSTAPPLLSVFDGTTPVDEVDLPPDTAGSRVPSVAINGASGRLYALTRPQSTGINSVQVFDPVEKADVALQAPADVTATAATLRGTVDPDGSAAAVHFELSTDGVTWASTPDQAVASGQTVEQRQEGLDPNTEYRVRLVATNANGTIRSAERRFTTPAAPPGVVTGRVTDRLEHNATLRGSVSPYGLQTTYYFEYGTTSAYGARVPASHGNVAGSGRTPRSVAVGVADLAPGTTYHYRLVARNAIGTTQGADRTFTTRSGLPARAFEQVSPREKGGSAVNPRMNFRASADGSRIAYRWRTPPQGAASAPTFSQSVAQRGGASWATSPVDPPLRPHTSEGGYYAQMATTVGVSKDLTKTVVISDRKLADGATEGRSNFYLYDFDAKSYTWMATSPRTDQGVDGTAIGASPFLGGSRDFSHVLLGGQSYSLIPGVPPTAVYEWTGGSLRVASIDENGDPQPTGLTAGTYKNAADPSWVSDDGSRVFFDVPGGGVYVRVNGTTTVPMSKSQRTGDPATPQPGTFIAASEDGSAAFFIAQDLTDDSPSATPALYRYDVGSGGLTMLVAAPDLTPDSVWNVSPTGRSVVVTSYTDLTPDATAGSLNVYMIRDGGKRLVATLEPSDSAIDPALRSVSHSGRYFAFSAYSQLTDYDNGTTTTCNEYGVDPFGVDACRQVYRYDADSDELVCASCRPDGGPVTGNAYLGTPLPASDGDINRPRVALDDGRVLFDTTERLDARDSNESRDVYLYDDGDAVLISGGRGRGSSELAEISPDGRSVFFTTNDQLVGTDDDTSTDLYVARIDGGLPAQNPEPPRGDCGGEDCRGSAAGPPSGTPAPSQSAGRVAQQPKRPEKATVRLGESSFRGTTLRLMVNVSGSGRIRVTGSKVATATRTATKAGTYRLEVRLKKKHRDLQRRGKRVKASVTVKFTPAFGKSVTSKLTRTAAR